MKPLNLDNQIETVSNPKPHAAFSHLAPCTCFGQVDEEKGYRKFGGCPFVPLSVRDMPANMRETAKQIRHNESLDGIINTILNHKF